MGYFLDYLRCSAFIFFLSFKPSEPHLSAYLNDVKHLTKHQRDAQVYTIYTYGSLVVVAILAVARVISFTSLRNTIFMSDRSTILLGCSGRLAARTLLLFGKSLFAMQVMQIAYSIGIIGEIAFYAYCLKVIPRQSQKLTAITQTSYLFSHTAAGILGDWLLRHTDIGLVGLMWISACSVLTASLIACTLRSVDVDKSVTAAGAAAGRAVGSGSSGDGTAEFMACEAAACLVEVATPQPRTMFVAIYSSRRFWLSTLWWILSYPLYQTVYGYESSIYYDCIKGSDNNGSIFAIGLLAGAACSLLLSLEIVEVSASGMSLFVFVLLSLVLSIMTGIMGRGQSNEWVLGISFATFFMSWSFANTLFYGETRRAVDSGLTQAEAASNNEAHPLAIRIVSTIFIVNSALGTLVNGLLAFVLFTWLELDTEVIFRAMAIIQFIITLAVSLLSTAMSAQTRAPRVKTQLATAELNAAS